MNKKITLGIVVVIVVIVAMLLTMRLIQNEPQPTVPDEGQIVVVPSEEQNEPITENSDLTTHKTFTNDEIGISFKYPDVFQRVDAHISDGYVSGTVYGEGDAGKRFSGVLEFASGRSISFGGVTSDYSAPRGGSIKDTLGYTKDGDQYFVKFIWGNYQVATAELWDTSDANSKALVMRDTGIGHVFGSDSVAVFVNIPNSEFEGVVFVPSSSDAKDMEILQDIVSSLTFN